MLKKLQGEDRIVKLFAFEEVEKVKFLFLKGTMWRQQIKLELFWCEWVASLTLLALTFRCEWHGEIDFDDINEWRFDLSHELVPVWTFLCEFMGGWWNCLVCSELEFNGAFDYYYVNGCCNELLWCEWMGKHCNNVVFIFFFGSRFKNVSSSFSRLLRSKRILEISVNILWVFPVARSLLRTKEEYANYIIGCRFLRFIRFLCLWRGIEAYSIEDSLRKVAKRRPIMYSVADPDPGSGMGESQHPDPGSGMNNQDYIF